MPRFLDSRRQRRTIASEIRAARIGRSSPGSTLIGLSTSDLVLGSSLAVHSSRAGRGTSMPTFYKSGSMYDLRGLPISQISGLLFAVLAFFSVTACGIQFSGPSNETELFKSISVTGDLNAGSALTVTVSVAQAYSVPVTVACFYEMPETLTKDQKDLRFSERAIKIGESLLQPSPPVHPGDGGTLKSVIFNFSIPEPGDYFLACLTPAAPENSLGISFRVTNLSD